MSRRKCGRCGHDPACGHASVYSGSTGVETWYCHEDDCSCYGPAQFADALPAFTWLVVDIVAAGCLEGDTPT